MNVGGNYERSSGGIMNDLVAQYDQKNQIECAVIIHASEENNQKLSASENGVEAGQIKGEYNVGD